MAQPVRIPTADRFALRLSAFYAAFFVYAGMSLPFLPVWLRAKGLDAREIGMVLAAPLLVRLLVVPVSTRLADRFALLRGTLVATTVASVAGFALLGLSDGLLLILAMMSLASVVWTPVLPLADAYALRGLAERRLAYGPVRLWGSVSFIAANFGGGLVLAWAGAANLIWAVVASQALTAVAALCLLPLAPERPASAASGRPTMPLWRLPAFLSIVAAASLIQASHAVLHGFATLQWAAKGLEGPAIGALWGLGVIAEICLFAASGRLVPLLGGPAMIALGGLGALIRWGAMAVDPPTALLPALQCLHALSFGATHLGAMHVLARLVPPGQGATAQGDFAAVQGLTLAAAMGVAGLLVEAYGHAAYAGMALMAAAGSAIAITARRCRSDADPI
jgi:PPP family 3-phenylpropionic acid transporter